MNKMERHQLIKEINKLLTENGGRMPETEVCQILNIKSFDIPWGNHQTWARSFQANQTFDLIQNKNRALFLTEKKDTDDE